MQRKEGMLAVFFGMLADLGGHFQRFENDQNKKQHNPPPSVFARPASSKGYNVAPWGSWIRRRAPGHLSKKVRSRQKRIIKRAEIKAMTAMTGGISVKTARRIWRNLQHVRAVLVD